MTSQAPAGGCPVLSGTADLVDSRLYSEGDAHAIWRELRHSNPVSWHPVGTSQGFWSITRHRDAEYVLRDHVTFTSERGTLVDLLGVDDPAGGNQMAVTDPPRHTTMREPLQRALSLKKVEAHSEVIRSQIRTLLTPLEEDGEFDFAAAMIAMPMAVTGVLMGLPEADWDWLTRLTTTCIAPEDPEYQHPRGREYTLQLAHRQLFAYFQDMVRDRLRDLGDDLISVLLRTELEGRTMSQDEAVSNCYSMLLGANVTTPHSPNFALSELIGTPALDDWIAHPELINNGVEEALRWASPVNHFLRYATRDVTVGDVRVREGQALVVWLGSANRDEDVFDSPFDFDIRRRSNRHLAFGAGPHYCVGHTVARVTLRLLFEELFTRFTDFAPTGPVERLRSNFVAGIKHQRISARRK
ncbi:cytochrome P450 [Streptomyces sp. NPDC008163]|uniref:cytochrome P450 n=1 Tax=Streptomyces sp. NPDC008163 TaxID=3364818 RepID=UPI0036E7F2D0